MQTFSDYGIDIPHGAAGEIRTLCPECSPTRRKASERCLAVNVDKGTWFCHHCGHAGGLHEDRPDQSRAEAQPKRQIRRPSYREPDKLPADIIKRFERRGIPADILKAERIGHGPSFGQKPGIQFPYIKGGAVVNVKHRGIEEKTFRQEKDAEKCLYRFDAIADDSGEPIIITEGEVDALSFLVAGFKRVTSIPDGAPSPEAKSYRTKFDFLKSAAAIFEKAEDVILAMDADAPGKTAEAELARRIGVEKCYVVTYPAGCKDANDVLRKHGPESLQKIIANAKPYPVSGLFMADDFKDRLNRLYDQGPQRGFSTGWPVLDRYLSIIAGMLSVFTGIPGSGKSTFLDALCVNLAEDHGWTFAAFSAENWPIERHIQSLLEKHIRKPFAHGGRETPRMTAEERDQGRAWVNNHFFFIVPDEDEFSVDWILERARVAVKRHGISGLIIDPWNEVEHDFNGLTETQYISQQLTKIRRFARRNSVHVWIVAHPRNLIKDKDGNYRAPTMYEISGGAHWRNKADIGVCLHRPDYSDHRTEVIVQKVRFREAGRIGKAELQFVQETGRYRHN
ncbi:MAG: toprim domain-containing protein [Desulfobacterales bacterium]|nr:toprim domain-containing protein [Desulfobacterales bacterium]